MALIKLTKWIFHGHVKTLYTTAMCSKYCLYACNISLCVDIFSDHWEHISFFPNMHLVYKELNPFAIYTDPPCNSAHLGMFVIGQKEG